MIPDLLLVALEFYREPRRFAAMANPRSALPPGITDLLAAPAHALAEDHIESTARSLNSSPEECREALVFFIKQVLLEAGGDHYRMLGLPRDASPEQVRHHYQYLIRLFHPDREGTQQRWDDLYAPRINEAYSVLRHPGKRADYDAALPPRDDFSPATVAPAPPSAYERAATAGSASPGWMKWAPMGAVTLVAVLAAVLLMPSRESSLLVNESVPPAIAPAIAPDRQEPAAGALPAASQEERASTAAEEKQAPSLGTDGDVSARQIADRWDAGSAISVDRKIEDLVRDRVREATAAVLGPEGAQPGAPVVRSRAVPRSANRTKAARPQVSAAPLPVSGESGSTRGERSAGDVDPVVAGHGQGSGGAPIEADDLMALASLLESLSRTYDLGDAQAFSGLFTPDASTSDASGRHEIQSLYAGYFANPESREMRILRFSWQPAGQGVFQGEGVAGITTRPWDGQPAASGELSLRLSVVRLDGKYRIADMRYHYL